jgi:hypothetical protein
VDEILNLAQHAIAEPLQRERLEIAQDFPITLRKVGSHAISSVAVSIMHIKPETNRQDIVGSNRGIKKTRAEAHPTAPSGVTPRPLSHPCEIH